MPTLEEILAKRRREQEESELSDERFFCTTSEKVKVESNSLTSETKPENTALGAAAPAALSVASEPQNSPTDSVPMESSDISPPPIPPRQYRRKSGGPGAKVLTTLETVGEEDEGNTGPESNMGTKPLEMPSSRGPKDVAAKDSEKPTLPAASTPPTPASTSDAPASLGRSALPLLRKLNPAAVPASSTSSSASPSTLNSKSQTAPGAVAPSAESTLDSVRRSAAAATALNSGPTASAASDQPSHVEPASGRSRFTAQTEALTPATPVPAATSTLPAAAAAVVPRPLAATVTGSLPGEALADRGRPFTGSGPRGQADIDGSGGGSSRGSDAESDSDDEQGALAREVELYQRRLREESQREAERAAAAAVAVAAVTGASTAPSAPKSAADVRSGPTPKSVADGGIAGSEAYVGRVETQRPGVNDPARPPEVRLPGARAAAETQLPAEARATEIRAANTLVAEVPAAQRGAGVKNFDNEAEGGGSDDDSDMAARIAEYQRQLRQRSLADAAGGPGTAGESAGGRKAGNDGDGKAAAALLGDKAFSGGKAGGGGEDDSDDERGARARAPASILRRKGEKKEKPGVVVTAQKQQKAELGVDTPDVLGALSRVSRRRPGPSLYDTTAAAAAAADGSGKSNDGAGGGESGDDGGDESSEEGGGGDDGLGAGDVPGIVIPDQKPVRLMFDDKPPAAALASEEADDAAAATGGADDIEGAVPLDFDPREYVIDTEKGGGGVAGKRGCSGRCRLPLRLRRLRTAVKHRLLNCPTWALVSELAGSYGTAMDVEGGCKRVLLENRSLPGSHGAPRSCVHCPIILY
jgi:hypothetical protein